MSYMEPIERFSNYDKEHCWQFDIRINNKKDDLLNHGLSEDQVKNLKCSDFDIQYESKSLIFDEVKNFIEKHEWLGKLSLYPTHFFTARLDGILAGVVIMDMPNAFSKLLGDDTRKIERLISRGACISWSPKNLASKLIMYAINWMVKHTEYRLFTAYSDIEAKELGIIYQACNFYYLGRKSGAGFQYKINNRWVSDRYFRSRSVYKRLAKQNNIIWQTSWQNGESILFENIPEDIVAKLRLLSKEYQNGCEKRKIEQKHKYAYVLGRNKAETKILRRKFEEMNKTYAYPKLRGC